MTADAFIQNLTDTLFVLIFVVILARTVRRPRIADIDATLFFGAVALIVADSWITSALNIKPGGPPTSIVDLLLIALPYLLLRLVDDYAGVPRRIKWFAGVGLILSIISLFTWSPLHPPPLLVLLLVAYFVALSGYVVVVVVRTARHSGGVTRRRMQAVALGSVFLGLVLLVAGISSATPQSLMTLWQSISECLGLACAVCYFIGFAAPGWLRRTWQEPELRAFLGRAASLPRLPDTWAIVRELERGAAASLGTGHAVIGVWNETDERLEFDEENRNGNRPLIDSLVQRAFAMQEPVFSGDAMRDNPADEALYRAYRVNSVLAVPITAGSRRLGVLGLYAARAPIFAEDDLTLAHLLADQAAVILESRALIDEAARVQAREEATRLKDDFLSAAAHDLKTPLTALVAQAQLMERRAKRDPAAPVDRRGLERIVRDSQRLRYLVTELLDVGRVEQGKLLGKREEVDLVTLLRESCERVASPLHPCYVEGDTSVRGSFDSVRMTQLFDNLIENAIKYSPEGGEVRLCVWQENGEARLTVTDRGIGIPAGDMPQLFDRFHRGGNVDDRRFSGMGLGLYICRGIAEQHGGLLWATSPGPGQGSTFHVDLPLCTPSLVPHEAGDTSSPEAGVAAGQFLVAPRESM